MIAEMCSEVMQVLQTAAFARYALRRDSPNNPSLATPSVTSRAPFLANCRIVDHTLE